MVKYICCQIAWLAVGAIAWASEPDASPELNDARVTLPYGELRNLLQAAQREKAPEKSKPPLEATLLAARYQLTIKGDQVSGLVEYETQSFTDNWTIIPLLGGQVQLDGIEPGEAQVITRDDRYVLATNRVGRQKLTLRIGAKLTDTADGMHLRIPIAAASINTLSVAGIPEKQTLRIPGGTQISEEKNRVTFRLPVQNELNFDLVAEKSSAPAIPSKWRLDAQALVQLAEGKLNYSAHLAASTHHGSGLSMELKFPAGVSITKVASPDLANWQATTGENENRIVQIHWQTRDVLRREIEVEYNSPQPLMANEWRLWSPVVIDGETAPALYVVMVEQGLELTSATPTAAPRQLPRWLVEQTDGLAPNFSTKNHSLTIDRHEINSHRKAAGTPARVWPSPPLPKIQN